MSIFLENTEKPEDVRAFLAAMTLPDVEVIQAAPRSPLPHKPHVQPPDWWHGEAEAASEALSARDWLARGGDG